VRIDAHLHFWRFVHSEFPWIQDGMKPLQRDLEPSLLEAEFDRQCIAGGIAVQARCRTQETDYLLSLSETHPVIQGVVGWVDPRDRHLARHLDTFEDHARLVGFRHLIQDEADPIGYLQDVRFTAGLATLQSRGYVYDLLIRESQLAVAARACAACDAHWIVLDHLAKPDIQRGDFAPWRTGLEAFKALPHVVAKLSGLVTEAGTRQSDQDFEPYLEAALDVFGPSRLMFGSDWPVCLLAASYERVCELIKTWSNRLSSDERARLWGATAARVYGLPGFTECAGAA
jgi:L-fuconolactonase